SWRLDGGERRRITSDYPLEAAEAEPGASRTARPDHRRNLWSARSGAGNRGEEPTGPEEPSRLNTENAD
ncbi:hypothetical protein N9L68_07720, partial [bacterium]|nr:hypothetical protein [bacterium]